MNRRGFLRVLGVSGATAGAAAAGINIPAAAKTVFEHKQVLSPPVVVDANTEFAKALWPGIERYDRVNKMQD